MELLDEDKDEDVGRSFGGGVGIELLFVPSKIDGGSTGPTRPRSPFFSSKPTGQCFSHTTGVDILSISASLQKGIDLIQRVLSCWCLALFGKEYVLMVSRSPSFLFSLTTDR